MCGALIGGLTLADHKPAATASAQSSVSVSDASGATSVSSSSELDYSDSVNRPDDGEKVWIIGTVDDRSLMTEAQRLGMTAGEFAATSYGAMYSEELLDSQQQALKELGGMVYDTKYHYTAIFNGLSMLVKYGDVEKIEESGVFKSVMISDTYALPEVTENNVNVWEDTGIYNSGNVTSYTGQGTVIAILDTGLDYSHSAFAMENFPNLDTDDLALTYDDVTNEVGNLEAARLNLANQNEELETDDVYISYKVPYAYDYADKDHDVFPVNDHGTHVAGIIGGDDDVITGVAVNAQLAIMKVFGNEDQGAETPDILAALSDCVLLGVDAINMSLGSSCGFAREGDKEEVNLIYDSIRASGICLICAASNDYSSAYNSLWGNTNLATNPDSGTVGSPASYPAAMAVASISGVKSYYAVADGELDVYFKESAKANGDNKNFVEEMLGSREEATFDYVVVPGTGEYSNYSGLDVRGKIAVIKRGVSTFEDKVLAAEEAGAVGCIIYNNVSGVISMSIGRSKLPACSVTMDIGKYFESKGTGTVFLSKKNQAGPFMSEFSSWGTLPDLELKPDITAHGGEIYSAVRGGYDTMSGTSMACPNMAGAIILIRQYVKESYPDFTPQEVTDMTYRLAMSTATIAYNEVGSPYSPRKQGAGLADIGKAVTSRGYIYVEGQNKTKLSLGDDVEKKGVYELTFNVSNTSNKPLTYKISPVVMTESMSSDEITVAETPYIFNDCGIERNVETVSGVKSVLSGDNLIVPGYSDAKVTVTVTLSAEDKAYLNGNFANGMFVEGFVKLLAQDAGGIDLNIPFLAFYGDWSAAPILDVSAYEVGAQEVDSSILEEDKLKPLVYGSLPMGEFLSQSVNGDPQEAMWGMGQTGYILADGYDDVPILEDKASLTQNIDGLYKLDGISLGLIRCAKRIEIKIKDAFTGELVFERTSYNAGKSSGLQERGAWVDVGFNVDELKLPNNAKYTLELECFLEGEYGERQNNNNKFSFTFYIDNESPVLVGDETTIKYDMDANGNITRRYLELAFYDNHYLQGFFISTCREMDGDTPVDSVALVSGMIPTPEVVRGTVNKYKLDITPYWNQIMENDGNLYIEAVDYARNRVQQFICLNSYISEVTGLSFRNNDGKTIDINGQVNLTGELNIEPRGVLTDGVKWESSDETKAIVKDGIVTGVSAGTVTITAYAEVFDYDEGVQKRIEATKTVTVRDRNKGEISITGITLSDTIMEMVVGESRQISATVEPYNKTNNNYELTWSSSNTAKIRIDVDPTDSSKATVTVLDYFGSASVTVRVKNSLINSSCVIRLKEEFSVESRYLEKYNGRGDENGVVEIPDDLGVLYISRSAFFGNEYIKKVIIPEGVETINEAAFYGCDNLEEVQLPESCATIGIYAFAWNPKLSTINLNHVTTINDLAFYNCSSIENLDLSHVSFVGSRTFCMCSGLKTLDITGVKYMGALAFAACYSLENIITGKYTQIGENAFIECVALRNVEFNGSALGDYAFANCTSLKSVVINSDLTALGDYAFYDCSALRTVKFNGTVGAIGDRTFAYCSSLTDFKLPDGLTKIGERAFAQDSQLTNVTASAYTNLNDVGTGAFINCVRLTSFKAVAGARYMQAQDGILYDKSGKTLIVAPFAKQYANNGTFTVPTDVLKIGKNAFSYNQALRTVNFNNVREIGDGAFVYSRINTLNGTNNIISIGSNAFSQTALTQVTIPANVQYIGDYAFAYTDDGTQDYTITIPASVTYLGTGVFGFCKHVAGFVNNSALKELPAYTFAGTDLAAVTATSLGGFTSLGAYAFADSEVASADLTGSHITALGEGVFGGCEKLTSVTLCEGITAIAPYAFADSGITSIVLPASVVEIGARAFADSRIEHIYSAASPAADDFGAVTKVGDYAFSNTALAAIKADELTEVGAYAFAVGRGTPSKLAAITAPKLTTIGDHAFAGAIFTEANLGEVKEIGAYAFENSKLTAANFAKAENVGEHAFENAASLASLTIPAVKSIQAYAFKGTDISSLALPAVESLAPRAFNGATALATVTIAEGGAYFVHEGDGAIYRTLSNGKFELFCLPSAANVTALTVLDRTVRIEAYAVADNPNVTSVTLPTTLLSIGAGAFYNADALASITMNCVTAPVLESDYVLNQYTYNNFKKDYSEEETAGVAISVPANGQGYDSRLWKQYVGDVATRTDVQESQSTIALYENIEAIDLNALTVDDYTAVLSYRRLYNLLDSDQMAFIPADFVTKLNAAVARVTELYNAAHPELSQNTSAVDGGNEVVASIVEIENGQNNTSAGGILAAIASVIAAIAIAAFAARGSRKS